MTYNQEIQTNQDDPRQLEALYRQAVQRQETAQFAADIDACLSENPNNLLYQAWQLRLAGDEKETSQPTGSSPNWKLAVPLALANGLVFWILTDPRLSIANDAPTLSIPGRAGDRLVRALVSVFHIKKEHPPHGCHQRRAGDPGGCRAAAAPIRKHKKRR